MKVQFFVDKIVLATFLCVKDSIFLESDFKIFVQQKTQRELNVEKFTSKHISHIGWSSTLSSIMAKFCKELNQPSNCLLELY